MRKIVFFTAASFFFLLCIYNVISYTNASVENKAALTITNPHGLLSFVPLHDQLCIRQGENKEALYVTNNLQTTISYSLEYDHDYLSLEQPDYGFLYPGESAVITLSAADSCPTGDFILTTALQVDFEGGSGRLLADLAVYVESGDLQLCSGDDGFVPFWNGGTTPDGTIIFYRYRNDPEGKWSDWIEVDEGSDLPYVPGYYEYKAVFGETESEIISSTMEPFAEEGEDAGSGTDSFDTGEEGSDFESDSEICTENLINLKT